MIQANDFRLGNLIDRGDYICKVTKIEQDGLITEPLNYKGERFVVQKIKPITLTPEILEKCGWVWNEECNSFEKYPNGDARMNLQFRELNCSYTMFNYVLKAKISDKIYYLHQLQNLFYFLCGEELTVNL